MHKDMKDCILLFVLSVLVARRKKFFDYKKRRCHSMQTINSAIAFKETHVASKEERVSSVDNETVESLLDHYDEPSYFFRGAIFGFILCVPFWAVIFWFIT
jgi:hypothetical protein